MDHLFANIGRYTDLLPVLLFVFFAFRKKVEEINKGLWVIFFYCLLVALYDNIFYSFVPDDYLNIVSSSFTLIEYFVFSYFLFVKTYSTKFKRTLSILFILFALFIILYVINVPFNHIDSVPVGIETILVIILSVYFLYEQVNKSIEVIYNTPAFWVITGFLFYLAGSFFIYLYANNIPYEELKRIWFVTYISTTIKTIFLAIAFWVAFHNKNNNTSNPREYQPFLN